MVEKYNRILHHLCYDTGIYNLSGLFELNFIIRYTLTLFTP
jgi:hypothetical protein